MLQIKLFATLFTLELPKQPARHVNHNRPYYLHHLYMQTMTKRKNRLKQCFYKIFLFKTNMRYSQH